MYLHDLSCGSDTDKISLHPVVKRIAKYTVIVLPALLLGSISHADELPKKAVQGAAVAKKAAKTRKSTQILQKASVLFTMEEVCRKGVEKAANAPKPNSWAFPSSTSALLILCGVLGLHMFQVLVEDD